MHRGALAAGGAALLALGLLTTPATAMADPTPESAQHLLGTQTRLVVADAAAGSVHVYAVPGHRRLATLTGRTFADHAGLLPLRDGRVLFVDEAGHELVALQVSGSPRVVGTAPLPEGEVTHMAADQSGRHVVVAAAEHHDHEEGGAEEEGHGTLTVVDLHDYRPSTVEIHTAHPGVVVSGDTVVHRNDADNRFETFPISAIIAGAGGHLEPTSTSPIGAHGHGEAQAGDLVVGATDAGLDVARVASGRLSPVRTIAWPATGRAYYVRTSADGRRLITYSSDESGADWPTWRHEAFLVDPATGRSTTAPLGDGFLFRHGLSARFAGYAVQRPDRDQVSFVDVRQGSAGYGTTTATVSLPKLPGGPVPGASPWGTQLRRIALDPSGALAYVTGGGTGKITVISPDLGKVVGTITTPTSLDGGGAVTVVTPGVDNADKVGR